MLDCYGFDSDQVSYFAAAMMICGILSATLVGLYIEKTLKYHRVFKILGIVGLIQAAGFPIVVGAMHDNFSMVFLLCAVMGIVLIPFMPLSFDYGCDVLYPAGEAQITGCLMTSGNFLGVILVNVGLCVDFGESECVGIGRSRKYGWGGSEGVTEDDNNGECGDCYRFGDVFFLQRGVKTIEIG